MQALSRGFTGKSWDCIKVLASAAGQTRPAGRGRLPLALSRFLRRAVAGACKKIGARPRVAVAQICCAHALRLQIWTAAPAPARLLLPQAAPRLRSQPVIPVFVLVQGDEAHHALDDTSAQRVGVAAPLALSRFLRRGAAPACKNRSAAPDTARLFRPLDAAGHVCHASVMARRPSV